MTTSAGGSGLYRGFSAEELERQYTPSAMVGGDLTPFVEAYTRLSAKARRELPCREDLSYGEAPEQVLDFFPAATANAPLVLFVHGGYWQELSHKQSAPMAAHVVGAGHAFATLNYTLAPTARLDQMVGEVARALDWLARHGGALGCDTSRITLVGHSAGAHLAAMQLHRDPAALGAAAGALEAVVLLSGVFDLRPIAQTGIDDVLKLTPAEVEGLSPQLLAPGSLSPVRGPVHVLAAQNDTPEFIRQSRDYAGHLGAAGIDSSFRIVAARNHFDIILDWALIAR